MEAKADTELEINLLQKFIFIPLDIFQKTRQNKGISNKADAWLTFFSTDKPEKIIELISAYPEFKPMYDNIYELCRNVERVISMFSKELQILDENTAQYMMDEMQEEIDELQGRVDEQQGKIDEQQGKLDEQKDMIDGLQETIDEKDKLIRHLQEQLKADKMN